MAKFTSIRRSLLVNLLGVVLALSGTILAITFIGSRQAVESLSSQLISQSIVQIETKLDGFFLPIKRSLQAAKYWGEKGLLEYKHPDDVQKLLVPIIKQYDQVSSMMVADNLGKEYMLLYSAGKWQSRITNRPKWNKRTKWKEWTKEGEYKEYWKEIEYDPRLRPWFIAAKDFATKNPNKSNSSELPTVKIPTHAKQLAWTKPYIFFTTKEPGITASVTFTEHTGLEKVIGLDVLLKDISMFTTNIQVSEHSKVFIIDNDRRVIGLPADGRFDNMSNWNEVLLNSPEKIGIQVISDATRAYDNLVNGYNGPFKFKSDGNIWWAGGKAYHLNDETTLWIATVIPEDDLLGNLSKIRFWIAVITISILFIAVLRAILLARRYSQPLELLVKQNKNISIGELDELLDIRSSIKEIRQLAAAQDSMRIGIKSLLKMERDLQLAQQIQRKTFPDKLPQIPGFKIYAWSEPADHAGGDTYDVIGIDEYHNVVSDESKVCSGILLLADATGHGIGPALSVTQVRAMLRMAVRTNLDIPEIAKNMNEQLCSDLHGGRFITAWLGELLADPPRLISYSAGQAPLLYYKASTKTVTILEADSPPFGILKTLETNNSTTIEFKPGDIYFALSDGLYEATNTLEQQFGIDRVVDLLVEYSALTPEQIFLYLKSSIDSFCDGAPATDDKTGIIIKYG